MSRASILAQGRAAAARGRSDTCLIERKTAETTGATGLPVRTWTTVYEGACRLQTRGNWATSRDIGQAGVVINQAELQLPHDAEPAVNDRVTITASLNDPHLVGEQFLIRGELPKSDATARRVMIQEVTG